MICPTCNGAGWLRSKKNGHLKACKTCRTHGELIPLCIHCYKEYLDCDCRTSGKKECQNGSTA